MNKGSTEIIKGSLTLIILEILSKNEEYGYSLAQAIRSGTKDLLKAGEGTLYPALYKLEKDGYIKSEWKAEFTPKRKYYTITKKGRGLLKLQKEEWSTFINIIQDYLIQN
ncbi:MAG: PadR family transcriptional regulator [Candidatus Dojkabacteria bacterium]